MRQSYQILTFCFIIILALLWHTFSTSQQSAQISHQAWEKYQESFNKLIHISIMLNQIEHLTRIYLTTTTTEDDFRLDELVLSASTARSTYIKHYLELEKLQLDNIEKQHLDRINQLASKLRLTQLAYENLLLKGIPIKQRWTLAVLNIISPQNETQSLIQEFQIYIRNKTISDSEIYMQQKHSGRLNVENLQLITQYLTFFLGVFSVFIVFKGQKTINDKNHALSQAERFLHSTLNSTPIALIITDKTGQIIMANINAEKVFEYPREQLVNMNISDLVPKNLRQQHQQHILDFTNNPVSREMYSGLTITALRRSGHHFPVEVGLSPVDGQDELYIACSIKDITEQKALENEILENKNKAERASQAKSDFMANVSHELRTPLHAILSFSRLGLKHSEQLLKEPQISQKLQTYFKKIHISGDKLLVFINDLLDSAKFESGRMELNFSSYNIKNAINSFLNEQEARLNELKLHVSVNDSVSDYSIQCDKRLIGQAINNLIANAIKYSPEGGKVDITIEPDTLLDASRQAQTAVRFTIRDEGPGIPESQLGSIFEKFIQSSNCIPGGTGLGLSLCKDIIAAHQGIIWAENNGTRGAAFSFIIPVAQPDNS